MRRTVLLQVEDCVGEEGGDVGEESQQPGQEYQQLDIPHRPGGQGGHGTHHGQEPQI